MLNMFVPSLKQDLSLSISDDSSTTFTPKELEPIGDLPNLETLRLSGVAIENIPAWFRNIGKLQVRSLGSSEKEH